MWKQHLSQLYEKAVFALIVSSRIYWCDKTDEEVEWLSDMLNICSPVESIPRNEHNYPKPSIYYQLPTNFLFSQIFAFVDGKHHLLMEKTSDWTQRKNCDKISILKQNQILSQMQMIESIIKTGILGQQFSLPFQKRLPTKCEFMLADWKATVLKVPTTVRNWKYNSSSTKPFSFREFRETICAYANRFLLLPKINVMTWWFCWCGQQSLIY